METSRSNVPVIERSGSNGSAGDERQWFRYWDRRTALLHIAGKHERELETARRARQEHPSRLRALFLEAEALAALGRLTDLGALLDESETLGADGVWTSGLVFLSVGMDLRTHDHPEASHGVLDRAMAWFASRTDRERRGQGHRWLYAMTLYYGERWEEARDVLGGLASEFSDSVLYRGRLGAVAARMGEGEEASRVFHWLETVDDTKLLGLPTELRARIAAVRGDSDTAMSLLKRAYAQGQGYSRWRHADMDFEPLRARPEFNDLIKPS